MITLIQECVQFAILIKGNQEMINLVNNSGTDEPLVVFSLTRAQTNFKHILLLLTTNE